MIANISQLNDRLWTGGDLDPDEETARRQVKEIAAAGITDVIDLRIEWDDSELFDGSGIYYHWLGVDDNGRAPNTEWWRSTIMFSRNIMQDESAVVLVHCHMGVNRGPSVAGAILVDQFGYDPLGAWEHIRSVRPMAYAIYLPSAAKYLGHDHLPVRRAIKAENKDGAVERTIGRIRELQEAGTVINQEAFTSSLQEDL